MLVNPGKESHRTPLKTLALEPNPHTNPDTGHLRAPNERQFSHDGLYLRCRVLGASKHLEKAI